MSMVGYLIGLGDRHGENVTLDATSGDTVHVDLNMIFNQGLHLKVPEIVPFRLTHNMVDAMGRLVHVINEYGEARFGMSNQPSDTQGLNGMQKLRYKLSS